MASGKTPHHRRRLLERAPAPFLVASQAVPVFALAPLLVVWLGYGMASKVLMAAVIIFFPITVTLLEGLKSCDAEYRTLFRLMGAGFATSFRKLYWPWALPDFFAGLRVGVSVATIGAVIGEWVGAGQGLGYLMIQANARLQVDLVFAAILYLSVMGLCLWGSVHVGYAIVPSLTSGRVAAVMGPFKTDETVTLEANGYIPRFFELEKWGLPDYDELIFVCGPESLLKKKPTVLAFRAAVQAGIDAARKNPEKALRDYFRQLPDADRRTETEAFARTLPYFAKTQQSDPVRWQRFADFALRHGLIDRPVGVQRLFPDTP